MKLFDYKLKVIFNEILRLPDGPGYSKGVNNKLG
jgi:hypothetical protein